MSNSPVERLRVQLIGRATGSESLGIGYAGQAAIRYEPHFATPLYDALSIESKIRSEFLRRVHGVRVLCYHACCMHN